jgi:hypothetical protein
MSEPVKLVLGFLVATLSALGYGLLAARFTKAENSQPRTNLGGDGAVGVTILTAIFLFANFFVALQHTVNLVILLPGVIAFAVFFQRRFLIDLPILALMIWWALQLSRSGPASWDHGLYHLQSTMWNTVEPAIPGIANLHARLGFNSSVFVLAAGLEIPRFGGWHLALVSPVLIEGMIVTDLLLSIRSSKEKVAAMYCFIAVVFLLFAPRWLIVLSYMSPDSVTALGIVYAIFLFLEKRNAVLLLFVPYLITVKLAAIPLLVLLDWKQSLRKYRAATIVGAAFLFLWMGRNVVLSGHLLFPVAATGLPVSWAVPEDVTRNTADWITSWAREPGKGLKDTQGLGWFRGWLSRTYANDAAKSAFDLFCVAIVLLVWTKALCRVDWRLVSALALALLFWFISAPDPRFGIGFMLATAFLMLAYGLDSTGLLRLEVGNTWIVIVILIVGLAKTASAEYTLEWPKMMPPKLRLAITSTGDRIWAPVPIEDRCWAVIPCAPAAEDIRYYPERVLELAPTP